MSKAKPNKKNSEDEMHVKLKPFLGMKPGLYLTVFYALLLIALLFLILFVPGIVRNGTYISFSTDPGNASVWIDGMFAGTTPCRLFIRKGEHQLVLRKPYYNVLDDTVRINGRLFGSLFFPREEVRTSTLSVSDLKNYLAWVHQEYSGWALIDNYHPAYQPPPLLSQAMAGLFAEKRNSAETDQVYSFLLSSMAGVNSEVILRDFLNALALYASGGTGTSPISIVKILEIIEELIDTEPLLPLWLYRAVPIEYRQSISETEWFSQAISYAASSGNMFGSTPAVSGSPLSFLGNIFIPVSGGNYAMGTGRRDAAGISESEVFLRLDAGFPIPGRAEVDGFYIHSTEVTKEQFTVFLNENSAWKKENLQALMDQGMVSDEYLRNWDETGSGDPVTYVSWYAAQAFCTWLETKLPRRLEGFTVRLPREEEWEWTAGSLMDEGNEPVFIRNGGVGPVSVSDSGVNYLGIYGLLGNVWEWCDNWFFDFPYLAALPEGTWPGAEKSVRGGCWANNAEEIGIETRGSQPLQWCTPFLGFRPVIVRDR